MANFRQVHTKMWKDSWFIELPAEHKLLFIYLFTNEQASISGIYELSERVISFETGLTQKEIKSAFEYFEQSQKAAFMGGVVWIFNLRKYHETQSPKVQNKIKKDLEMVKDGTLKGKYCELYGIDMVSEENDRVCIPPFTSMYTSTFKSNSIDGGMGEDLELEEKCQDCGTHEPNGSGFCSYCQTRHSYKQFFPKRRQPQAKNTKLRIKFNTRMKSADFKELHIKALERAAPSVFLANGGWFDFGWFVKNDENWRKCYDGNYDNGQQTNGRQPTANKLTPEQRTAAAMARVGIKT